MTTLVPSRMGLRSLFDSTPIEQWLGNVFDEVATVPKTFGEWGIPRADIRETDQDFFINIELPGLTEKEVEVKITGNQLIVAGEKQFMKEKDDEHYHRVERHYGSFERRFDLPPRVRIDAQSIKANFDKGILEIRVPKLETEPVAKIPVSFS